MSPRTISRARRAVAALALLAAGVLAAPAARAQDAPALLARRAILELELDTAAHILELASSGVGEDVERARLAVYRGDCDEAVRLLGRPEMEHDEGGAALIGVARGCARGTAATVTLTDEAAGVTVRFQDDEDVALFPILVATAVAARDMLARELETEMPRPLRIDLVRDQFTLAALSGLPERAAQTTGAVAVAKYGRVLMVSPRAASHGYPWLDTLTHELTHLAIARKSADRAPLWLQEGVAKRQETRWRPAEPLDDVPSYDAIAAVGMQRGLGVRLDEIGPSIAMLPSAEQAGVAFAQVTSFIRFLLRESGEAALPRLLATMRDALPTGDVVDGALKLSTGRTLKEWDARWRADLALTKHELAPDEQPGADVPEAVPYGKKLRLAELLRERGHPNQAAKVARDAHLLLPAEAAARAELALALLAAGRKDEAAPFVSDVTELHGQTGRWWSLHALLHGDPDGTARARALAREPLSAAVACEELAPPDLPKDPARAAVCAAARRVPR
ncbi:MAG: tetratricopeptide repeat protein [Myxococcales bacterium]|nr:tetratricopeptide repeat protein [Myxococcales bacterium]